VIAMTTTLNLYQAKTQLSKLVERAAAGEEIVIAKAGKPMARLVALESRGRPRNFGALKGQIWMADDFDELPKDILDAFYDGDSGPNEDSCDK
jgi:prevent-host-death family protein